MTPTLVILAAGMGSRYGGLKQMDPMGPNGETLLDFSLQDAANAGFGRAVFVIRRDFADAFREKVGEPHRDRLDVDYVFQELDDLPAGFTVPENRAKPWGTAHAVRAAREAVNDPFVAINADDYYGRDAYQRIVGKLRELDPAESGAMATVGYPLGQTLSTNGTVNRGICRLDGDHLGTVEEHTEISRSGESITGVNLHGERVPLAATDLVSLNFWAFTPAFFQPLETEFVHFLQEHGTEPKSECYIPTVVDTLIHDGRGRCEVLPTTGEWFGVTHPEDKPLVQARLRELPVQS